MTSCRAEIHLDGDVVHYICDMETSWTCRLHDVRIIGEYTTDKGPFVDDYYLMLVISHDVTKMASFGTEGIERFLQELEVLLSVKFMRRLIGSTDFDSNILWPEQLAGQPLYDFTPHRPTTLVGRIAATFLGLKQIHVSYSKVAAAQLEALPVPLKNIETAEGSADV